MEDKKQYYGLDEIGFIGTQSKRTNFQVKKDIKMTIKFIKARKSGKIIPLSKKGVRRLSKAK
jgi:hypothetical protein